MIDATVCMLFFIAEYVPSRANAEGTEFRGQENAEF
jgi:hypothetical protein